MVEVSRPGFPQGRVAAQFRGKNWQARLRSGRYETPPSQTLHEKAATSAGEGAPFPDGRPLRRAGVDALAQVRLERTGQVGGGSGEQSHRQAAAPLNGHRRRRVTRTSRSLLL